MSQVFSEIFSFIYLFCALLALQIEVTEPGKKLEIILNMHKDKDQCNSRIFAAWTLNYDSDTVCWKPQRRQIIDDCSRL